MKTGKADAGAEPWVPPDGDVASLRDAVHGCRGCELWAPATQAVFSEGPDDARLVLVGEQPGDREDREGQPFVGPAGRVLHDALADAGVDPERVYVTNAVKHFRFEERGARRIHKKPGVGHVRACHPWLEAELAAVAPRVVVCLGATAARAVLGRDVTIGEARGTLLTGGPADLPGAPGAGGIRRGRAGSATAGSATAARAVLVTAHPSSVLRLRDSAERRAAQQALVADLRVAAAAADDSEAPRGDARA